METRSAEALNFKYANASTLELMRAFVEIEFPHKIAIVSSFGSEAAVLLHIAATVNPGIPVLFINTGKMFGETLRYRDVLQARLGLTDTRTIAPHPSDLARNDEQGILHSESPDLCCAIRKVRPLVRALQGFDAWISGRKRYQSAQRAGLERIEYVDGFYKLNPIADWSKQVIDQYCVDHDLPTHPLIKDGYFSIGCMPCTDRVAPGEDSRAGRWRGLTKSECGIHDIRGAIEEGIDV